MQQLLQSPAGKTLGRSLFLLLHAAYLFTSVVPLLLLTARTEEQAAGPILLFSLLSNAGNIAFLMGALLRTRWVLGLGWAYFSLSALVHLPTVLYAPASVIFSLPIALILLTIAVLAFAPSLIAPPVTAGASSVRWTIGGVAGGILIVLAPIALLFADLQRSVGTVGGVAPQGTFAERQAWGREVFAQYTPFIEQWIASSPLIAGHVGSPVEMAPIDGPNLRVGCFTDGCYTSINVEVRGPSGIGLLTIPHLSVSTNGANKTTTSVGSPSWKFGGRTYDLTAEGRSLTESLGIEPALSELLAIDPKGNPLRFIEVYERANAIEKLPWRSRREIVRGYANALRAAGRDEDAVRTLLQVADKERAEISSAMIDSAPDEKVLQRLEALRQTLLEVRAIAGSKRKPIEREDIDFFDLYHAASKGVSTTPPYTEEERAAWSRRYLDWLMKSARQIAEASPVIRSAVGTISDVVQDPNGHSNVGINYRGYYWSGMYVEVRGDRGKGRLYFVVDESPMGGVPPMDPLVVPHRDWGPKIRISQVRWTPEGGGEVQLTSKGEMRP